ncbi:MAG: acetate/propionate family kinase, partial [Vicinamibacterales bacterium]
FKWVEAQVDRGALSAVGHRLVHGGATHREAQRLTAAVLADIAALVPLAPNHLPDELALIEAVQRYDSRLVQIACFDTAFHRDMPEVAYRLPIPAEDHERGVRRYGFHGISYEYLIEACRRLAGTEVANGRVILAHLGNGSSLAAVKGGRSIDTTMAFTPIGGVAMSTRSGDLDPGVVTYLARTGRLTADEVEHVLSRRSGLLGISGVSGDMRTLLEREAGDPACRLAVAVYVYGIVKAIGALAAAMDGVDLLVFSGGIGAHAPVIRRRVCDGLTFLGIELEVTRNDANAALISSGRSRFPVRVIQTDEELVIARAAYRLLRAE